jgi:hypothetical protein
LPSLILHLLCRAGAVALFWDQRALGTKRENIG